MVKIYNIHSNTISIEDLKELGEKLDEGKDLFLLNEDIRYEVIDFEKMTTMKSKNYIKNIYAIYKKVHNASKVISCAIKYIIKIILRR